MTGLTPRSGARRVALAVNTRPLRCVALAFAAVFVFALAAGPVKADSARSSVIGRRKNASATGATGAKPCAVSDETA